MSDRKKLDDKYSYQIDDNYTVHLFRNEEERCDLLTNPLLVAIFRIEELETRNEKMKCCGNCKYGYCGTSSISTDENGNKTFHNWNKEKQEYCDIGKNGKYQCWELAE